MLTFHGLDTQAEIKFNGIDIDTTSNMFLRYTYDVKRRIRPVRIKFCSNDFIL